jgi:hypothetical protein
MAYSLQKNAPSACDPTAKNRVWGFFAESNRTRPVNRRQPLEPRRKNRPCSYKTASGRPYWPSRDPIEEFGLPDDYEDYEEIEFVQIGNLYAFGPNDPINGFDRDGEIWGLVIRGVVLVGSKVGRFIKPRPIPRPPVPKPPTPKPPTPKPKPKPKGCRPCLPGIGTLMYRVDETGKPHGGIPCPHSHQFSVNQIPYPSCVCKINKTGVVLPGRHGPPVTPVAGGGKL